MQRSSSCQFQESFYAVNDIHLQLSRILTDGATNLENPPEWFAFNQFTYQPIIFHLNFVCAIDFYLYAYTGLDIISSGRVLATISFVMDGNIHKPKTF